MNTYHDYLFILSPPGYINEKVKKYKQSSVRLIGDFEGRRSKAHISMKTPKHQRPGELDQLFDKLEKELSLIEPFTLHINGFATFLPTDFTTIYAAIKSTPEMEDWFKRLRKCLEEKKTIPHITIARQVPNEKAKKLWSKFKDRPWDKGFEVDRLTILQRNSHGKERYWRVFREILFRGDKELNRFVEKDKGKKKSVVDENQISLF
jgi:2'-5' RNA ligase